MAAHPIHRDFLVLHPPHRAIREWQGQYDKWLAQLGYFAGQQTTDTVSYSRRYTPGFAIFFAVILFPIGLLFLLSKRYYTVSFVFRPHPSGSVVTVSGSGSRDFIAAVERVADDHQEEAAAAGALPVSAALEPARPSEARPASSVIDDLERLQRLRDAGTLSQEQFEAQRQRVLDRDG